MDLTMVDMSWATGRAFGNDAIFYHVPWDKRNSISLITTPGCLPGEELKIRLHREVLRAPDGSLSVSEDMRGYALFTPIVAIATPASEPSSIEQTEDEERVKLGEETSDYERAIKTE